MKMIRKLTYKEVKEYIESKECILLDEVYINTSEKLNIQCKCGNTYQVDFSTFKKGQQQCKECGMKKRTVRRQKDKNGFYSFEDVEEVLKNTDSKLLSTEYHGCFEKLELECKCGEHYRQNFAHIKKKIKSKQPILCPKCMKKIADEGFRHGGKEINKRIFNKYGFQKFVIIDVENYTNTHSKNLYQHTECGHIFESNLTNLIQCERLCPNCETEHSKGVYAIIRYLEENNIEFEMEKTFKDCKHERHLPFDFYLPKYDCCIEYDGEQHFRKTELFGGQKALEVTQLRDEIKNEYCKTNNIPLLRINFKENENIPLILKEFIDKLIPR